jgi:hypothetical protein
MTTTRIATAADQGVINPTPMMSEKAKMQLHAGSMIECTNGKTVLRTGEARTTTMTVQKFKHILPGPHLKVPTQTGELEEKSKVQRINDPPTDPQLTVSTSIAKPMMHPHAAAMPHTAN